MTEQKSRAQQLVGDVAPKLAELTDEVLFGDVWARPQLLRRNRSLVTVVALTALGRTDQLPLAPELGTGRTSDRTGAGRPPPKGGDDEGPCGAVHPRCVGGWHHRRSPERLAQYIRDINGGKRPRDRQVLRADYVED